jgi:hypothetical protein
MDMSDKSKFDVEAALFADGKRAVARDSLFFIGKLIFTETQSVHDIRIRNLSPSGMMAESPVLGLVGQSVEVEMKWIGRVPGKIAWVSDKRMGIAFDSLIDPKAARQPIGTVANDAPALFKPVSGRRSGLKIP